MVKTITLAENVPHDTADRVRQLVYNRYNGLRVYKSLASEYSDTAYRYNLTCEGLTKPQAADITSYVLGVIDCVKSY